MKSEIEQFKAGLSSADEADRRYAIEDLTDFGDPEAIPLVLEMLKDPATSVREAAVESLMSFGQDPSFAATVSEGVAKFLYAEEVPLRNYACEVLERLGQSALTEVARELSSDNTDVLKFAVDVIGRMKGLNLEDFPVLHQRLVELLSDSRENIAVAAAEALGLLGDQHFIQEAVRNLGRSVWLDCAILEALRAAQAFRVLIQIPETALHADSRGYFQQMLKSLEAA